MYKVSNFITINESLDWFGSEMGSRIRIKIENWKKTFCIIKIYPIKWKVTLIHNDKIYNLLLCTKYPILLQLMNLWADSGWKWGLESESISKIERKHLLHIDIPN